MSRFNSYFLMKEKDVIEYIQEKLSYFDKDANLTCKEIGDGNLNYVFRVKEIDSERSIIVKQAGTHLRISDEMTLTRDRGRIESNILRLQGHLCPGQVPKVYLYDGTMSVMVMEDMIHHTMMRTGLLAHETYPKFADQISSFLVHSLLLTSDVVLDHKDKKALVKEYINPELCEITEDLVFGEPILNYNNRNDVYPPMQDFVQKEIYQDEDLKQAVATLKFRFMNDAQSLIHGDLHTGSIFINKEHTFVFDPEFAFYGPMGYDIGNVLANLFFACVNGLSTITDLQEKKAFCDWCIQSIVDTTDLFKEKYRRLFPKACKEAMAKDSIFMENYLKDILKDTAGYAGTECIRRIVGIAHNKDITTISDQTSRICAEKIILYFAKDLILNQSNFQSGSDYYNSMARAILKVYPDSTLLTAPKTILDYDTVSLDDDKHALVIIDQTKLPSRIEMLSLTKQTEIWDAIYLLKVRGAPAIGVAAAIGIYLAAREICADSFEDFYKQFKKASDYLNSSRPTAVNLSWALHRMEEVVLAHKEDSIPVIVEALHAQAIAIHKEDIEVCRSIGTYGLSLLKKGDGLLTHCNAGQLATVKYGTATAPMYLGHEQGYDFKIYCDETRPLLQGARLTSFELKSAGMDVSVLCDNMSASLMRQGGINAIFVGCDRVAANGDTANKIGTSMLALAAKRYNVPFYVCAPTSTIDLSLQTGDEIIIEQRKPMEVTDMWYKEPMVAPGIGVYNPAFDVTDQDLITAIITEYGIVYPPFAENFKEIFLRKEIKKTVEEIVDQLGI